MARAEGERGGNEEVRSGPFGRLIARGLWASERMDFGFSLSESGAMGASEQRIVTRLRFSQAAGGQGA